MDIKPKSGRGIGRRGYLYTIAVILLVIPLTLLILFYTSTTRTKLEDLSGRIRCDELYYFVQDVEYDLERAMLIFGRRAAIYAIDDVVTNNRTLHNYTFHNCTDYVYTNNGSEAALAELVLCGTLYGQNVTYMVNHTVPIWLDRIEADAEERGYSLDIDIQNITIVPYNAWNFAIILDNNVRIEDETGLCYYTGTNVTFESLTDIIGLEDPLYPLHTSNRITKYIYNCSPDISIESLAGCSTENWGDGTGAGNIVFYSNIKDDPGLGEYCATTSDINDVILVFDMAFGACSGLEYDCFDITNPHHLAGVIEYAKNDPESSFVDKCNVTIPWISATGKIDNETQQGQGHQADPDCQDGYLTTGTCALIKNIPDCDVHNVLLGYSSDEVNTTCYVISNVTQYEAGCDERYPNGPSFFDRLDGRLNLSEKYMNQSLEHFGNPYIGIETLVSLYDLAEHGVSPNTGATWVDYLYWANKTGSPVMGVCAGGTYEFRLDCQHAYAYSLDTAEVNASGVPPVSIVLEPANDTLREGCSSVHINGSADDCDGDVEEVQLSINGVWYNTTWDGGWWNYTFTPQETNKYTLISRAVDNDGLYETPSTETVIFVANCTGGDNNPPTTPQLISPADGETGVERDPTFAWFAASDASGIYRYQLQCDQSAPDWDNPEIDVYVWETIYHYDSSLSNNKWYSWRVRAQDNAGNWGDWSEIWEFKT